MVYGRSGREAFARAHPALFGRSYEVALRGYERWLARANMLDDLDAFAAYTTARFERAASVTQHEFPLNESGAHSIYVQQVVQGALVDEHRMGWTTLGRQPQHR